jgi:DNA recombination protein RmuC
MQRSTAIREQSIAAGSRTGGVWMVDWLAVATLAVAVVAVVLLIVQVGRDPLRGLGERLAGLRADQERIERAVGAQIAQNREETGRQAKELREEVHSSLTQASNTITRTLGVISNAQKDQLEAFSKRLVELSEGSERRSEALRDTVDARLKALQEDNSKKLDQMRQTVDEKLQSTLEKRLGESFKQVSERLEQVHKGLGEMRTLAEGVGDLKKVLTNVSTRGGWGEIRLAAILEQILTPEQYAENVETVPGSGKRVEFAIRLPGGDGDDGQPVWLPIDAKFPKEDYERLVAAQEQADGTLIESIAKDIERAIKNSAKDISTKYLHPPHTTDFAIMFVPTEGLYAEVLRRPGLVESLQREHRVAVSGPTTLAALLNSLQMGFRTLAIQKRSSEVWKLLGAVKTTFGHFGDSLSAVRKKLKEADSKLDDVDVKTRKIQRKLRDVQELPVADSPALDAPSLLPVDEDDT